VPLHYGQIVIVSEMTDPNGVNPKDRPPVVVTPTDEIDPNGSIIVVAISTLLPGPAPDDCVELPWDRRRHPRTGLRTRCAAIVPWIQEVPIGRIIGSIGIVPVAQLKAIAVKLAEMKDQK
jgi:hypothetical protein